MMARAEALEFEQAAEMRNQIGALSRVLHQQSVEDNTGVRRRRRHPRGQGRGRPGLRQPGDGARRPPSRRPAVLPEARRERSRPPKADAEAVPRRGAGARGLHRPALPRRRPCRRRWSSAIRVDEGADRGAVEQSGVNGRRVQHQPREQRRAWLEMASKARGSRWPSCSPRKARSRRARARWSTRSTSSVEDLTRFRIECFDISHTAGEATQASCVVFETTRCRARSTGATTSTASRPATTTRRCARC